MAFLEIPLFRGAANRLLLRIDRFHRKEGVLCSMGLSLRQTTLQLSLSHEKRFLSYDRHITSNHGGASVMTINTALLAVKAALMAGKAILDIYETDFRIEHKADDSPLTQADCEAHRILTDHLTPTGLPILSEEGRHLDFDRRRRWAQFWLVDPLDGTKEFIKRNGEFTVNVALIEARSPTMGVVYAPVDDILYFSLPLEGAFKISTARRLWASTIESLPNSEDQIRTLQDLGEKLPIAKAVPDVFTIVGSRSHGSRELDAVVDQMRTIHGKVDFISAGSSLKLCLVAEGRAHLYPRTGPTMEWDTAAGQAIAEAGGAEVVAFGSDTPLRYNKEDLLNPWFVVRRGPQPNAQP
jgi:3'(2'), 5'-bisphosphate nucleotidase